MNCHRPFRCLHFTSLLLATLVVASATLYAGHIAISVPSAYEGLPVFSRETTKRKVPSLTCVICGPFYACRMWPSLYVHYVAQFICAVCDPVYMCSMWPSLFEQSVAKIICIACGPVYMCSRWPSLYVQNVA